MIFSFRRRNMKNIRGLMLSLTMGLAMVFTAASFAQDPAQNDQKKQADSCCAMSCCDGDSCHVSDMKNHSEKASCCCGDSCDAKMKHDAKNHAAKGECCCCNGDSCDAKMKHDMKNHSDEKEGNCCSADSCKMKVKSTKSAS
jgi:hypothetical protein